GILLLGESLRPGRHRRSSGQEPCRPRSIGMGLSHFSNRSTRIVTETGFEGPARGVNYRHGSALCRRHRFPSPIIQHAIWLYLRFTLSYRDVEELLAERGLEVSYETVRRWVLKFGPMVARRAAGAAATPERPVASGRDGRSHRRQADVSVA